MTDRLRELKDRSGISTVGLAQATGITRQTIVSYLNGMCQPSVRNAITIADYFGVSLDYLFGRTDTYEWHYPDLRRKDYEAAIIRARAGGSVKDYLRMLGSGESPWPYNLLDDLVMGRWESEISEDQEAGLMSMIKRVEVLEYYRDGKTLDAIGKEHGVTRECIRQKIAREVRKMRHPTRMNYVKYGLAGYERKKQLTEGERELNAWEDELNMRKAYLGEVKPPKDLTVDDMDLSVRSWNCLKRMGCNTVTDVCRVAEKGELLNVRNLGKKSLKEILEKLEVLTGKEYWGVYA